MLPYLPFISLLTSTSLAAYTVVDDYTPNDFANKFNFFTGNDPTNGYVNYVDYGTASSSGLYNVKNNQVYIGVDSTNTATGRGRNSVRIESKRSYQHGLIVLDLAHMPSSACGTWPAFWLLSTAGTWPNGGEIDIIEGVNAQNYNTMAIHTTPGCSISNTGGMSGTMTTSNCDINAPGQASNQGCAIRTSRTDSYGDGFNAVGGGVYATEWTSDGISIWFFPRSAIPADLTAGSPSPDNWGLPMAHFAGGCDWDSKVVSQQIIFDVTFCGDWAGGVFSSDPTCSAKGKSCQAYVQNTPSAFAQSYWSINSLKVYQENGQAAPTATYTTTKAIQTTAPIYTTPSTLATLAVPTTGIVTSTLQVTPSIPVIPNFTTSTMTAIIPGTLSLTTSTQYIPLYTPPAIPTIDTIAIPPVPINTAPNVPSETLMTVTLTQAWGNWQSQPTAQSDNHQGWGNWGGRGRRPWGSS